MLVTFSGLDGAGKSTQIVALEQHLRSAGQRVSSLTMYDDVSFSAALRQTVRKLLGRDSARPAPMAPAGSRAAGFRWDKNRTEPWTLALRQVVYVLDLLHFLFLAARERRRGSQAIVMDRYFFDSLANVEGPRGWRRLYTRLLLALMPIPDVPILLDVDATVAFGRKPEYPLDYTIDRRESYLRIFGSVPGALIVDGGSRPDDIQQIIRLRVDALLPRRT